MSLAGASSLLSQHVGGIYYINLDRRPKRRHALEEQFGRSRLLSALGRPRRVVGIDGRTLPLRELVENGDIVVPLVSTNDNFSDCFTKALKPPAFYTFRNHIM